MPTTTEGDDTPSPMYTTYYQDGQTLIETLFPNEETGPIWVGILNNIKEGADRIVNNYPFATTPQNQTDESRQRILTWIRTVDEVETVFGVLCPSIIRARDGFREAVGAVVNAPAPAPTPASAQAPENSP